ncbi:MAG: GAF domain-containing protein [Pseudanabaenaceae cyanobacterium]
MNIQEVLNVDLWEKIPIGVYLINILGTVLWANSCACQFLGLPEAEVIGHPIFHRGVVGADGKPLLPEQLPFYQAISTAQPVRQVVLGITQPHKKWFSVDAIPRCNDKGEVLVVVITCQDITAQREAERQKQNLSQRIQSILNNSFNGVVILQNDRVIEANPKFAQMLGYTMTELLELSPKDWEPEIKDHIRPSRINTNVYQAVHHRKDGSTYDAEVVVTPLEIEGEEYYVCIVKDISYQKAMEAALKKSREQFINIFQSISDSVIYIDRDYVIQFANNLFLAKFDKPAEEVFYTYFPDIIGTEQFNRIKPKLDRCLQGEFVTFSDWFTYPRIGRRYVSVTYYPYRNQKKEVLGVVITCRDITAEKLVQEELIQQRNQGNFIATIANILLQNQDYQEFLEAVVPLLGNYLQCDRVLIYQFENRAIAKVVAATEAGEQQICQLCIDEHVWQVNQVITISDVSSADYSEAYKEFLLAQGIRAQMVTGIWCDQKLWGGIFVQQRQPRQWRELERECLQSVSVQLGIAIYKSNLYLSLQQQLAQSHLLYRLAGCIKDAVALEEKFNYITLEIGRFYPHAIVTIQQYDPKNLTWSIQSCYPLHCQDYSAPPASFFAAVLEGETVIFSNADQQELLVPVKLDDMVWGCLTVQTSPTHVWTPEAQQFIQTIVDQLTVAIKNDQETISRIAVQNELLRLNNELEEMVFNRTNALMESQLLLRAQYEQDKLINRIIDRIRNTIDLQQMLQVTVQEVRDLIQTHRVIIYQIMPDGTGQVLAEAVDSHTPELLNMQFSPEVFPQECYQAFLQGRISVINSPQQVGVECLRQFMQSLGVQATVVIGLTFDDQLWGLLILHHCDQERVWQPTEIKLLERISQSLSLAIKQADLYQRLETQVKQLMELNQALELKLRQEQLINLILEQVRWSGSIQEILILAATEIRYFLEADRVSILQVRDGKVTRSFQSPRDGAITAVDCDTFLGEFSQGNYYQDSHKLILPILIQNNKVWGFIIVFNCLPTKWHTTTIKLMSQVTNHLGLAIDRLNLYYKMESELRQKNALLKEVHHRVKNNLQIMSSILRMQSRRVDKLLLPVIDDAQNRIYAMALVHEQLYKTGNFAAISMREYVTQLVQTIFTTYADRSKDIETVIDIPDISIPLEKTIPLGLIFNELITNAVKYAFPEGKGKFTIQVQQTATGIEITVADNGIGLPPGFDLTQAKSLGILLVTDLTEQLEGKISYRNDNGAVFTLVLPPFSSAPNA